MRCPAAHPARPSGDSARRVRARHRQTIERPPELAGESPAAIRAGAPRRRQVGGGGEGRPDFWPPGGCGSCRCPAGHPGRPSSDSAPRPPRAQSRRRTYAGDRRLIFALSPRGAHRSLLLPSASTTIAALLGNSCVGDGQRPVTLITSTPLMKWLVICSSIGPWPCHRAFDLVTKFVHRVSFHAQPQAVHSDSLWMGRYRYPGVAGSAQHYCRIQSIGLKALARGSRFTTCRSA